MISLRALLSREPESMLGLDVSTSSIKLVELGRGQQGALQLRHVAQEMLEPGWINDGSIENFDAVADAMQRLFKKSGVQARQAVMALPASAVITRRIVLPGGLSEQELELQVEVEANQYIPFPLEEVYLDFCVIGANARSADEVDVLLAATRREKVQDMQGLAEAAGLKLQVIEVASNAARLAADRLIQKLPGNGRGAVVALFDVGALSTRMQILCDAEVLYEREQTFGGNQLTQALVQQYGFPPEEAERRKRSGDLPEDYAAMVLQPYQEALVQEVSRALQFFFSSTSHSRVDSILLAGGAVVLPGLAAAVTEQTGFPCEVADPFTGLSMAASLSSQRALRDAPAYLTAFGLALRGFFP